MDQNNDTETERRLLKQKNDTLEKKVESLVKFLENERRLRHELEDLMKQNELKDREVSTKLASIKRQSEDFSSREQMLSSELTSLKEENHLLKTRNDELDRDSSIKQRENKELKEKVEELSKKVTSLDRQNVNLYQQYRDAQTGKQISSQIEGIQTSMHNKEAMSPILKENNYNSQNSILNSPKIGNYLPP